MFGDSEGRFVVKYEKISRPNEVVCFKARAEAVGEDYGRSAVAPVMERLGRMLVTPELPSEEGVLGGLTVRFASKATLLRMMESLSFAQSQGPHFEARGEAPTEIYFVPPKRQERSVGRPAGIRWFVDYEALTVTPEMVMINF